MRFVTRGLLCAIAATLVSLVSAHLQSAHAFQRNVSFCNRSTEAVSVAVGYDLSGTTQITSKGWTKIAPCSCRNVLNAELRATEIFVLTVKQGSTTPLVAGRAFLCIHPRNAFEHRSGNADATSCRRHGGTWVKFVYHDTGTQTDYAIEHRRSGQQCNL